MKKYFALLLAALVLCGSLSFFLVSPVSAVSYSGTYSGWYHVSGEDGFRCDSMTDVYCCIPMRASEANFSRLEDCDDYENYEFAHPSEIGSEGVVLCYGRLFCYGSGLAFLLRDRPFDSFESELYIATDFYVCFYEPVELEFGNNTLCFEPIDPDASFGDSDSLYDSVFALITDAFYGEDAVLSGSQELVATSLATGVLVFMFALPFGLLAGVLLLICGGFRRW